jgi:hypothetical protein
MFLWRPQALVAPRLIISLGWEGETRLAVLEKVGMTDMSFRSQGCFLGII